MKTGATWDNLQVRVSPLLLFLAFNSTTEPVHWAVEKPPVFVLPVIVADSDTLVGENFHLVGHTTIDLESNLVGGWPTPLKKYESQLGIWFHIYGKILQTTNQNISLQKPLLTTINHHYGCCKPPTRCILLVHSPRFLIISTFPRVPLRSRPIFVGCFSQTAEGTPLLIPSTKNKCIIYTYIYMNMYIYLWFWWPINLIFVILGGWAYLT